MVQQESNSALKTIVSRVGRNIETPQVNQKITLKNSMNTKTLLGILFATIFLVIMLSPSVFAQDEKETGKKFDPHLNGNVYIGPGETVTISKGPTGIGKVNGNIDVDGGVLIVKNGASADGNIEVINGKVIIGDAKINGNIEVDGGFLNVKNGATVNGNIEVFNGGTIILDGIIIHGNIESNESAFVIITGNSIYGNMKIEDPKGVCFDLRNNVKGNTSGCS